MSFERAPLFSADTSRLPFSILINIHPHRPCRRILSNPPRHWRFVFPVNTAINYTLSLERTTSSSLSIHSCNIIEHTQTLSRSRYLPFVSIQFKNKVSPSKRPAGKYPPNISSPRLSCLHRPFNFHPLNPTILSALLLSTPYSAEDQSKTETDAHSQFPRARRRSVCRSGPASSDRSTYRDAANQR